jgi:transcriptional regulator with XRE-family HTH domain
MPHDFPLKFSLQLRQHLKALRKKHGLTQAQLGKALGISQARIAEIEANPGLVNFEQMLELLSALGVSLVLRDEFDTQGGAHGKLHAQDKKVVPSKTTALQGLLPKGTKLNYQIQSSIPKPTSTKGQDIGWQQINPVKTIIKYKEKDLTSAKAAKHSIPEDKSSTAKSRKPSGVFINKKTLGDEASNKDQHSILGRYHVMRNKKGSW